MKLLQLPSWSFPDLSHFLNQLLGQQDLPSLPAIAKTVEMRTWESFDILLRDTQHLGLLTPSLETIADSIPEDALRFLSVQAIEAWVNATQNARLLNDAASEGLRSRYLGDRTIIAQLVYLIAKAIQGSPVDPEAFVRQSLAIEFMQALRRTDFSHFSAQAREEFAQLEQMLGHLHLLRLYHTVNAHAFLPEELTLAGLRKYGVPDLRGLSVCNWCGGVPCVCGSRKDVMKAARAEQEAGFAQHYGLLHMEEFMYLVYSTRNSAITPFTGPIRAFSEAGGELGYVELLQLFGSYVETKKRLGPLYLVGTRHDVMGQQEIASGRYSLREGALFEAADAVISWPSLVPLAFGLSPTRSVARGLLYIAKTIGCEVQLPEMKLLSGQTLSM